MACYHCHAAARLLHEHHCKLLPPVAAGRLCHSHLTCRLHFRPRQNVITPTTKAEDHDVPISPADIVAQGLMTQVGSLGWASTPGMQVVGSRGSCACCLLVILVMVGRRC